jgi:hypothetical protein
MTEQKVPGDDLAERVGLSEDRLDGIEHAVRFIGEELELHTTALDDLLRWKADTAASRFAVGPS